MANASVFQTRSRERIGQAIAASLTHEHLVRLFPEANPAQAQRGDPATLPLVMMGNHARPRGSGKRRFSRKGAKAQIENTQTENLIEHVILEKKKQFASALPTNESFDSGALGHYPIRYAPRANPRHDERTPPTEKDRARPRDRSGSIRDPVGAR
jgi:hypothetical protein